MKLSANMHPKAPCNQPFDKSLAENARQHRDKNLELRITDYQKMVNNPQFKSTGFHCPGSNKK